MTRFDDIVADFAFLDDWDDRYKYLIDLGRSLPPYPEEKRADALKVRGCASQVWIHFTPEASPKGTRLHLTGDSDALIVKGLMAIVFGLLSGLTAREIAEHETQGALASLGLHAHLTQQRSNGLASMVERIKSEARSMVSAESPA